MTTALWFIYAVGVGALYESGLRDVRDFTPPRWWDHAMSGTCAMLWPLIVTVAIVYRGALWLSTRRWLP